MFDFSCPYLYLNTSSFGTTFAGGIDKEETLADGTKLIYVSTDRIREVCLEYWDKSEEIKNQKYSVTKDWVIKGVSLAVAACGCYLSAKAGATQDDDGSYWTLAGQIASCLLGFVGFMYPDYHEHELIRQHGSEFSLAGNNIDNTKSYIHQWGPESTEQGIFYIYQSLYARFLNDAGPMHVLSKEEIDSGACIVIRPESLRDKEDSINSPCFHTGVYTQLEMNEPKNPTEGHQHGYRWVLINNCIPGNH